MAEEVVFDGHVTFNSIDISSYITSVNPTEESRRLEPSNTMGDDAMGSEGVLDEPVRLEIEGFQDLAGAAGPRAAFAPFWTKLGSATLTRRHLSTAVGVANPQRSGTFSIIEYDPGSGSMGEKCKFRATLVSSGAVTYAIA